MTARKIADELGIEAAKWTEFGRIEENTSITKSFINLFLAQKLNFTEPQPEDIEKIEIIKMPLAEGVKKVMSGEITHDLTCILILKANLLLKNNRLNCTLTKRT